MALTVAFRGMPVDVRLDLADHAWVAPVSFCDPWPAPFGLLGQEGFLRFFDVELRTAVGGRRFGAVDP